MQTFNNKIMKFSDVFEKGLFDNLCYNFSKSVKKTLLILIYLDISYKIYNFRKHKSLKSSDRKTKKYQFFINFYFSHF